MVKELVGDDEKRYKFVQFHPSYDYSDFVEGLRPVEMKESHNPTFVRLDGTFKKFCRQIVEEGLENAYKKDNTKFEDADISEKEKFLTNLYEKAKKKEYTDDELEAFNRETTYYYFIIDEINRADLSKVFGELMFGLEESYRGIENRFDTQYMNLNTYEIDKDGKAKPIEFDCFKDGFFIPKNLKFIGTMNDIDRSVESFDFALRRRFQWIDMKANEMMLDSLEHMLDKNKVDKNKLESLVERIQKMNDILSDSKYGFGLSEAYHIGPAYFKKYNGTDESLETIFNEKIEPIIREYTRGRSADKVEEFVKKCRNQLLKNQKGQMNGGND